MSEEKVIERDEVRDIAAIDAETVKLVCGNIERTKVLVEWMDRLIMENVAMVVMDANAREEVHCGHNSHYSSQNTAYWRIKEAAKRALDSAEGQPPGSGGQETAGGGVL